MNLRHSRAVEVGIGDTSVESVRHLVAILRQTKQAILINIGRRGSPVEQNALLEIIGSQALRSRETINGCTFVVIEFGTSDRNGFELLIGVVKSQVGCRLVDTRCVAVMGTSANRHIGERSNP